MTGDALISEIQRKFRHSCPSSMVLGWDRNRFYDLLLSLFVGYKVKNQTDFNYSYCNSFDIEMHLKRPSGRFCRVTLQISFIVDAYIVYHTAHSKGKKRGKGIPSERISEAQLHIEKIKQFMEQKGFQEIVDEFDIIVPDVELELAEIATIGKCLFDDF
jgi:hypothetical protein